MKLFFTICSVILLSTLSFSQTTVTKSFMHGGISRSYIVYTPTIYTPSTPVPILLNFHGYTSNATEQMYYGDFRGIADTANFIIVHPQGTIDGSGNTHFNVGWGGSSVNDVSFTSALIDTLIANYAVDDSRIYSTGMSNGGFMSYHLACNLSSKIAAIGSVTGSMVAATESNCNSNHPTPIIEIHGTSDGTVPYNGSPGLSVSIPTVLNHWVTYNNCDLTPIVTQVPNTNTSDGSTVEKSVYLNGDNCSEVVHFKVIGGGHTWAGSAFSSPGTNYDINASKEVWNFVSRFNINGKINCQPLSVIEEDVSIGVYPNPAQDILNINGASIGTIYSIFSIEGKLVLNGMLTGTSISIAELDPNIYFLTIEEKTTKFIKSNN